MIKGLIRHGNSKALVIDRATLQAAGIDEETALFQITVDPNGGITIQSVQAANDQLHEHAFQEILKENDALMKRLQQR